MPLYEYRCTACDHALEALQQVGAAPLRDCPACGQSTLRKKISAVAFRLKGSGWYETDFKTGKRKNLTEGGDGGEAEAKPAGEGKEKQEQKKEAPGEKGAKGEKESAKSSFSKEKKDTATSGNADSGSTAAGV